MSKQPTDKSRFDALLKAAMHTPPIKSVKKSASQKSDGSKGKRAGQRKSAGASS